MELAATWLSSDELMCVQVRRMLAPAVYTESEDEEEIVRLGAAIIHKSCQRTFAKFRSLSSRRFVDSSVRIFKHD